MRSRKNNVIFFLANDDESKLNQIEWGFILWIEFQFDALASFDLQFRLGFEVWFKSKFSSRKLQDVKKDLEFKKLLEVEGFTK